MKVQMYNGKEAIRNRGSRGVEKHVSDTDDFKNQILEQSIAAELYAAGKEKTSAASVQNGIRTEGTGKDMVKTTIFNGQRIYLVDGEVMEAHGYTVHPDYFCRIIQTWEEGEKRDALSAEELDALKQKYDSDNMTRKDCIDLLGELVEAGIMSTDEAAAVYRGLVPQNITLNGTLQKCTPELEAARARWNKVSGGIDSSDNLNKKMGYEYFTAWYDWARISSNVDHPEQEKSLINTRKFIDILKELRA